MSFDLNSPEDDPKSFGPYPVNRAVQGLRGKGFDGRGPLTPRQRQDRHLGHSRRDFAPHGGMGGVESVAADAKQPRLHPRAS